MTTSESICEPCCRGDVQSEGFSWCSDCEEILCITCDTSHRVGKLTISHSTTNLQELSSIPKGTQVNINFCEKHPEKHLDAFCAFHDALCCHTCILESHRTCDKVVPVEDVSINIKSSALAEDVSKAMSSLILTCKTTIENRKQNKESMIKQEADIKTAVTTFKENVIKQLQMLEESLLLELPKQRDAVILTLDSQIQEFGQMEQRMVAIKHEFDFNVKYGSNNKVFRILEKFKHEVLAEEKRIQEMLSKMENFSLNYFVNDVVSIIPSLAKISTVSKQSGIHHTACIQERAQFVPTLLSLTPFKSIDLSIHGTSTITGIELTDDNRLLLCDARGKKILMYKEDGTFLRCQDLKGIPYQISLIGNTKQAVVTITDREYILIIDTDNLTKVKRINTGKGYFGVHVPKDMPCLIVGGKGSIDIISMDGKINKTFPLSDNFCSRCIIKPQSYKLLFTDCYNLRCINLIDGTEVFTYNSTTEARGIAEDKYGCLYIADKVKNTIHRVSPDGTAMDIVLRKSDGIKSPLALKFNNDHSRLYVGMTENKFMAVFQCK